MVKSEHKLGRRIITRRDTIFLELMSRLFYPLLLLFLTQVVGTIGYYVIGVYLAKDWSLLDCILMTSITLTTVGYGDVFNAMHSRIYEIYTITLMWVGMGVTLYSISTITAFIVEKQLARYFKERKMRKKIEALSDHYIVCGAGNTGIHIINEMVQTRKNFVAIDTSEERMLKLETQFPDMLYIVGDATEEEVLKLAGIERAAGLIACLATDSLNMLLTVSVRYINKKIKIITRCIDYPLADKLRLSGADTVVSPNFIGGMRIASEMLRPHVTGFLDKMLRGRDNSIRFDEVTIGEGSHLDGKTIAEAKIHHHTGLNIVAIEHKGKNEYFYNPPNDTMLSAGDVLVTIGNADQMASMRKLVK